MTQKPTPDKTIDDIHRIRREISERFNGDLTAIAEDAARRQAASDRPLWQPDTTNIAIWRLDIRSDWQRLISTDLAERQTKPKSK